MGLGGNVCSPVHHTMLEYAPVLSTYEVLNYAEYVFKRVRTTYALGGRHVCRSICMTTKTKPRSDGFLLPLASPGGGCKKIPLLAFVGLFLKRQD